MGQEEKRGGEASASISEQEFDSLAHKFGEWGHNDLPITLGDLSLYQKCLNMDPKAEARLNEKMDNKPYMDGVMKGLEALRATSADYFGGEAKYNTLLALADKFVRRYQQRQAQAGTKR